MEDPKNHPENPPKTTPRAMKMDKMADLFNIAGISFQEGSILK